MTIDGQDEIMKVITQKRYVTFGHFPRYLFSAYIQPKCNYFTLFFFTF